MRILMLASLFVATAGHAGAARELHFVNKCKSRVLVAITSHVVSMGAVAAEKPLSNYWANEGWLPLGPGGKHTVNVADTRSVNALVQLDNGKVLTGDDGTFCVHGKPFSTREYAKDGKSQYFVLGYEDRDNHWTSDRADTCVGAGGHLRNGFQRIDFKDNRAMTFNITCN